MYAQREKRVEWVERGEKSLHTKCSQEGKLQNVVK